MKIGRDHLHVDGQEVAVDATTLPLHGVRPGREKRPELRFDKVVVRITERLHAAADACAPAGVTVAITLTAPIKVAAKTATAIEAKMRTLVARSAMEPHARFTALGNRVTIHVVSHGLADAPRLIGFVHNPRTDPRLLFHLTREMLDLAAATARRRASARGLVVMCGRSRTCLQAYRYIWSQLTPATTTRKILLVFSDGQAEFLTT